MSFIPAVTGKIDSNNSSSSTLLANNIFTGTLTQVTLYSEITINISSDVASATNGLSLQFSSDGTNWDTQVNYTFAPTNTTKTTPVLARYFRIVYTNGATNQTFFRLQTLLHPSKNLLVGQNTMQNSSPVTIASDQTTVPTYLDSNFSNEVGFKTAYVDPFSKLITTQSTMLGSFDFRIGKNTDYWDETIAGNATSTHNANTVSVNLTCTTNATDSVIRQTYRQFEYVRGNSQTIYISINLGGGPVTNNRRRVGYFDTNNGAYFEIDSTTFKVVRRTSTSGSVVNNEINQADFNVDKLNGTGPSGITLDLTKQQLFYIEFSWLGTNTVEFGAFINTQKILMHVINNANVIATAWCQSGQLPLRVENTNTGTPASSTTINQGCMAVFSNGSETSYRMIRSIASAGAGFSLTATETVYAGIRLNPNLRNIGCQALSYQLLPYTAGNNTRYIYYKVILRATLTGDTWANVTNVIQGLTSTPTYTGGIIIDQGYLSALSAARVTQNIQSSTDAILGYSISNVPDTLILTLQLNTGANGCSLQFTGNFREIN